MLVFLLILINMYVFGINLKSVHSVSLSLLPFYFLALTFMAQHDRVSENEQSGNKNGINFVENGESANGKKGQIRTYRTTTLNLKYRCL